jgi:hypothetical protein
MAMRGLFDRSHQQAASNAAINSAGQSRLLFELTIKVS